jgi:uncharacterized iron-regulated membrane protein
VSLKSGLWRALIVGHRWLGVATCLFFAMWFATGLVMMYVGFPAHTSSERIALLEAIDWRQVRIGPDRVLRELDLPEFPRDFRLHMMAGEPVYRVTTGARMRYSVSARNGLAIGGVDPENARRIVQQATGLRAKTVVTLERDQWTVANTFDPHRPLHRVVLDDDRGLEFYVSSSTGEIVLDTDARERAWNWLGAVLHWLYFTDLRANVPLWSAVVTWISGIGIVVALTGIWLGIDRLVMARRGGKRRLTQFRGWMAWHHVVGLFGGLFVLTFIFSGWLSMGPRVPWEGKFDPSRRAYAADVLAGFSAPEFPAVPMDSREETDVREATFSWVLGEPHIVFVDGVGNRNVLRAAGASGPAFDEHALSAHAPRLMPDAKLMSAERLDEEDAYWYSRRHRERQRLPVLRFKFADADETWIHVDPQTGQLVGWQRRSDRIDRWLFNALHSFDFRWLIARRPVWDIFMWSISLAGLALSATSLVVGWRALRR